MVFSNLFWNFASFKWKVPESVSPFYCFENSVIALWPLECICHREKESVQKLIKLIWSLFCRAEVQVYFYIEGDGKTQSLAMNKLEWKDMHFQNTVDIISYLSQVPYPNIKAKNINMTQIDIQLFPAPSPGINKLMPRESNQLAAHRLFEPRGDL